MSKNVVIVGAGYAGIEAAIKLSKKSRKDELNITLIDKNEYHTLLTELHEVAANRISEEGIIIPLKRIFDNTNVEIIQDTITNFDFSNKKVVSATNSFNYDYLVMAVGSETNFFGIPGVQENSFTLWSYDDAIKLRSHIKNCFEKASKCNDDKARKALLTFVVVGAGFTGSEMIGELVFYARDLAKYYGIDRKEVKLQLVDAMDKVLPIFGGKNSEKTHKKMLKYGIDIMLSTGVKTITPDGVQAGETFIPSKTVIWTAGVRASAAGEDMDLEKKKARRVEVDKFCQTKHKGVYAIGDFSAHSDEKGTMYPAMVENALQTAAGAALNILHDIRGETQQPVEVKMHGAMVCVGPFWGCCDLMGWKLPFWLSQIMKYFVNAHYLWGIVGFGGVANYFYHEFLEKKQNRNFFERHWSPKVQAWWLFPLRMFLGVMWLYEGLLKANQGWFTNAKLAAFLGVADASSGASASGAFVNSYKDIFHLNIKIVDFLLATETRVAQGIDISSQMLVKVKLFHFGDFDLMDWIVRHIICANDDVSMFFQIMVVVMEIGVGLCLIGGIFNFPASGISTILVLMFVTTTGVYQSSWWMLFASIAVLGGAGRAVGLDNYFIPWLHNILDRKHKNRNFKLAFKGAFKKWDDR